MNLAGFHSKRFLAPALAGTAIGLGVCGIALAQPAPPGAAQDYPTKPITLVVPFPPGGGVDLAARVLADKLTPRLGQRLVVEYRPAVGGLPGANVVARSAPDGHMLLIAPNTIAISPHLLTKGAGGGVDVLKDLVPVIMPAMVPAHLNPAECRRRAGAWSISPCRA